MAINSIFRNGILEDRVAFVAGGTSGINLALATGLSQAGAKVAVAGRDTERARAAAASITQHTGNQALALSCDVRDYDAVVNAYKAIGDEFGEIDTVISGAAGNFLCPVTDMSANAFKTVVDIDLLGTFNVFRAGFDYLRKPGASLLAITAPQADNEMPYQAHVCAAKAGVNMLVKCLALEWGAAGIRVNGLSPGATEGTYGLEAWAGDRLDQLVEQIPLKRFGSKAQLASTALFLCSEAADYITGSIYRCDGGLENGDASQDMLTPLKRKRN